MGLLEALKQSFLGGAPPTAPRRQPELDPPFRFMFGHNGPVPDVPVPPDAERLLDRWVAAWTALVDELRTTPGRINADTRKRWQQARPVVLRHPAIAESGEVMALDHPRGEEVFFRNRLAHHGERMDFPTFDRAWLEHRRAQIAAWDKFGDGLDWSGAEIAGGARLAAVAAGPQQSLRDVLSEMRTPKPPPKWTDKAAALASGSHGPAIRQAITDWFATLPAAGDAARAKLWPDVAAHRSFRSRVLAQTRLVGSPETAALVAFFNSFMPVQLYTDGSGDFWVDQPDPAMLSDEAALLARAAVWMLAQWPDAVAALRHAAETSLVRLSADRRRLDYRSLTVANACILALGEIGTTDAVQALGRIKLGVRDQRLSKQIAVAMDGASERASMAVEDLQELSVPTFDLDAVGIRTVPLGEVTATLRILSTTDVTIGFTRADGKAVKAVPATVKTDKQANTALKALKAQAKAIGEALPVHRRRIEQLYLTRRSWPYAGWRERFLDHPLVGTLARRLIWTVTTVDGRARALIWHDGALVDSAGTPPSGLAAAATVSLWHPLDADDAEVAAWRAFLMRNKVVQPFKQAHREIYPITDAERATGTYSNRFAGHILRQHQSVALARQRGWQATMAICADVSPPVSTHIRMPDFEIAAEFWTSGSNDAETTGNQAYVYLGTDRVRFRSLVRGGDGRPGLGDAVALDAVPPRIFSEAMRDVDLMVGVASIGNDPTWRDPGADAPHPSDWHRAAHRYWVDHNHKELDVCGRNRRQMLAELLPSLTIADQCTLDDRHLIVRGKLRTYRIHIGSTNILMDNHYLCIVPANAPEKPLLPFEGDYAVSVLLSKAFMLASDDKITDRGILRQIMR